MATCLSSFWLKMIAVVAMVIDHVGMAMFPGNMVFRFIGRIAFPIYCFLIVEGFYHTSDIKKYIGRLAVFAVISEIPFNILVSDSFFCREYQNVYFTLLIGLVTIYAIHRTVNPMLKSLILVGGVVLSTALMTDYSYYGVVLIYVFYIMGEKRVMACGIMAVMSILMSTIQGAASFASLPILMYNGKKGPAFADKKVWKYGFYAFYPVHMLVLYILKVML